MTTDKTTQITPMMAQYLEIKERYSDALLFYRMGDFYELFFEDAEAASAALDIALTKRGKHQGQDIAMCGVPHHAAEGYLLTLIRKGFRVAICEQMESPAEAKKRGSKSVVKRDVVRLVTPGTLTEDTLLDARHNNFLAAYCEIREMGALAWVDVSTGDLQVCPCSRTRLGPQLARIAPSEVLVRDDQFGELVDLIEEMGPVSTALGGASFDSGNAEKRIGDVFQTSGSSGFGDFSKQELGALGALIDYLDTTQRGRLPNLRPPEREPEKAVVQIDAATRRNLELVRSLSGDRSGGLLAAVDRTVTGPGARLMERRLTSPSTELDVIISRHDAISALIDQSDLCDALIRHLRQVPDMERALSRLSLDRGGPRDLAAIRDGLAQCQDLFDLMGKIALPELLDQARSALQGFDAVQTLLDQALVADPPLLARDGGFVASGYDAELDEVCKLRDEGRGVIAGMQAEYVDKSGVSSLKIKHNNVLGYFVETPATHKDRMMEPPLNELFIHRQTTANQIRFTTLALSELETRILNAAGHALELEKTIYSTLTAAVLEESGGIGAACKALAEFDLAASHADLAVELNWSRPVVDQSLAFEIKDGRHPVVERALRREGKQFIPNDSDLSGDADGSKSIWLITGPNMAGKSTFLRQNALIALLAQSGAFVPAEAAHIGVMDQIFSRVGAADDLARGQSTFMVEMVETAAILNQAGPRAFVILDEIGRGTATYDGLSIAWATLEHLHDVNRCRALFATHYHELTGLTDRLDGLKNATVTVREWNDDVVFLHEVKAGVADRSYGVQVARLAGLPKPVIDRARVVLDALEDGDRGTTGGGKAALIDDLPLFSATPVQAKPGPHQSSDLGDRLQDVLPDTLTPREALDLVYELKALATKDHR